MVLKVESLFGFFRILWGRSSEACLPARSYTPLNVPPLPQVSAVADAGGKRDTRRRLKSWLDNRLKSKKGWVSSRALSLHGVQEQKLGKQQIFTLANQWKEIVYMTCPRCLGHVGWVIIAYLLIVRGHRNLLLLSIQINFSFGNKVIIIWIIFKTDRANPAGRECVSVFQRLDR